MSLRIKAVVDKFVQELKEALDADIQDRIMKEREMQSYIEERDVTLLNVKLLGKPSSLVVRQRLPAMKRG